MSEFVMSLIIVGIIIVAIVAIVKRSPTTFRSKNGEIALKTDDDRKEEEKK